MGLRNRVGAQTFRFAGAMRRKPTEAERLLRRELNRQAAYRFKFQVVILGYIADFYCAKAKLVIEVDGSSHDGRKREDESRDAQLRDKAGILTLRFSNEEVLSDVSGVVRKVLTFCKGIRKK